MSKLRLAPSGPLIKGDANGDVLIWNATLEEWLPGPQSGGGSGAQLVGRVFENDVPYAINANTGGWISVPHATGESAQFEGFAEPGWAFDADQGTITWNGPGIASVQVTMQICIKPPAAQELGFGVGFSILPEQPSYGGVSTQHNVTLVQVQYFDLGAGAQLRGFISGDPPASGTEMQITRYSLDVLLLGLTP